ncbi:hypothetical protein DY000_02022826 [Brassica cretica]|uniref:Uncharacterized protein n=1 Tax=Brassica cretica TaxID=69181 RepID=A0ABQ7EH36_BRACR|nr:hypothetical protein DY000_02022826 [Brassica cretica]
MFFVRRPRPSSCIGDVVGNGSVAIVDFSGATVAGCAVSTVESKEQAVAVETTAVSESDAGEDVLIAGKLEDACGSVAAVS